jgi:hypothetical protein
LSRVDDDRSSRPICGHKRGRGDTVDNSQTTAEDRCELATRSQQRVVESGRFSVLVKRIDCREHDGSMVGSR